MAQATEKEEKLTTISARNVTRKTKRDFLKVLKKEKVGGQSDFINWCVDLANSPLSKEFFEALRNLNARLENGEIHTGTRG
ncbi:hypothetical protein V9L05_08795 [Bernardetia sp. Wsw4-3y2]|uniref:hypothetical protein n=1 Tax=Bernardetia sp. Wsw4-3y2 TaxID=3127471 RepID=UPI0030CBB748